jgi:hypothetical protein
LNVQEFVHKIITIDGMVSFPVSIFESMFLSLIDDSQIKEHLLFNWDDPSSPPTFDSGWLDKIQSGMWHERTSAKFENQKQQ